MEKITVIGVGRLGLCTALVFEAKNYDVLGIDVFQEYVDSLNNKTFKSTEPYLNSYLRYSKNFRASTDLTEGLNFSDLIFILVQTPTLKDKKEYDHSIIVDVLKKINDRKVSNKHIIICSTVMPGFITKIAKPLLKDCVNTYLAYNPEFIAQGSIIHDLHTSSMVLIGEENKETGNKLQQIYEKIAHDARICRMSIESAEITKIGLNCFITTKIAFANMIGDIADKTIGANKDDILFAIGSDLRVGNKCLKAGFGFGGPCFPRDNRALEHYANLVGINPLIPIATDESNKFHTEFQFQSMNNLSDKIVLENVGYKDNCPVPIIEESQKLIIANKLVKAGRKVILVDSDIILNEVKKIHGDKFTYVSKDKFIHKTYIVHYSKLTERKKYMTVQLIDNDYENKVSPVQWLTLFDRELMTPEIVSEVFKYDYNICPRRLGAPEICCYRSHAHAIEEIANDETILSGMILEDDIMFKKNYVKHLETLSKIVPNNWEIIVVGGSHQHGIDNTSNDEKDDPKKFYIYTPKSRDVPTGNYIIRKEACKKVLKSGLFKPFSQPIDDNMSMIASKLGLIVYWCRPWLSLEGSKNGLFDTSAERGF